ncbi:DNA polymerase alpha/epsilon subunit B-domain-containing protein [Elsinoe ampelina]|uniref:DNA polymerase epsilon subunit B n=1 Tax=Elsinoe ampelina TaxID=302913 RepID=A0A6A6GRN7_9PEZI|nr:DNA polymerase alpha/epsilon subunit B-domain-containing protein [Elsinoe ampelina]
MAATARIADNALPSSSPAFGTPVHPFNPGRPIAQPAFKPSIPTIIQILLPPASLRPLAFRTFTKKHNLTLGSSALQALATFVGRHCGSGWREDGTAEKVLEEIAQQWKRNSGPVIVEDSQLLKELLKTLEGCMVSGRIDPAKSTLSRQSSVFDPNCSAVPPPLTHQTSFGLSKLEVDDESEAIARDPRTWLSVLPPGQHPRFTFSAQKSHFLPINTKPSLLPPPSARTNSLLSRYHIIHALTLRNPAFQAPTVSTTRHLSRSASSLTPSQTYRLTPIANLLGRTGTTHLLLGMLSVSPAGSLLLQDPTGAIALDLAHARPLGATFATAPWIYPGAIVLLEGVYQEDFSGAGSSGLGGGSGVGGTIGGKFIGFSIGVPPVERRNSALGVVDDSVKTEKGEESIGGGFGWTSFLPAGSEKATGARMRRIERGVMGRLAPERRKVVLLGEVNCDVPECLEGLKRVLNHYSREKDEDKLPLAFVLIGSFVSSAAMCEGKAGGSIEYKEGYNALAAVLADFPALLRASKWLFVPGDNDAWPSAFGMGSSVALPQDGVPEVFTSRIKRVFREARSEGPKKDGVEEEWCSNPARVTLFGTAHEMVVLRDDISGRMRRSAINYGREAKEEDRASQDDTAAATEDVVMSGALDADDSQPNNDSTPAPAAQPDEVDPTTAFARKLVLSMLPQGHLSPFPLATRPVHWAYNTGAGPMSLYPLPHTLVLADAEAPAFAVTYEGCHVVNPGRLVKGEGSRKKKVGWVEYDAVSKRGEVREMWI